MCMHKVKKYLAIDLGASSGRGIVGSFDGEKLSLRENCRFANEPVQIGDRLHWDILRIFHEIKNSIRQTVYDNDDVVSIGIDTWGVDYGLLDEFGRLITNPVHYRDVRNIGIEEYAWQKVPFEKIYGITGIQSMNFNTVYQLCAEIKENHSIFENVDKMLFIPDLLNYFLTGEMAMEYTIASTGAILDAQSRCLSRDLLNGFSIPGDLFAPLVQSGNRLGSIRDSLKSEFGGLDLTVVNVASHDTASAVVAVPNQAKDVLYISSGTWSLMGTELNAPIINGNSIKYNCTNEGGVENTIRFLKNIMGLWILQESRRQWKREGSDYSFAELEQMARSATPFAAFIDPDDTRFALPGDMPSRVCEYCRETNQYIPQTVGEVVRCIYESLSLKYRYIASNIINIANINPQVINVVGGGSKDRLLNQMTADACGVPVVAGPAEATAIGNLIVQAISDGEINNLQEGRAIIENSFEFETFSPSSGDEWNSAYERFLKFLK